MYQHRNVRIFALGMQWGLLQCIVQSICSSICFSAPLCAFPSFPTFVDLQWVGRYEEEKKGEGKCWNSSRLLYLFFSHILLISLKLPSHKNDKRNALNCKYIPCFLIVEYEKAYRCLSKCYDLKVNRQDGEEFFVFSPLPRFCKKCILISSAKGRGNKTWCRFNFYDSLEKLLSRPSWELYLELGSCVDKVLTSDIKVEVLDGTRREPGPAISGTRDNLQHYFHQLPPWPVQWHWPQGPLAKLCQSAFFYGRYITCNPQHDQWE